MGNSGKALGIVALLIAIGAFGLGLYPIIFGSTSPFTKTSTDGPKIYVVSNNTQVPLNYYGWKAIPLINITYNTNDDDLVLIEYSCLINLDVVTAESYIKICFVIDSIRLTTSSYIYLYGFYAEDSQEYDSAIMRHYIESSTAGEHTVSVDVYIDDSASSSWVSFSVLKVEIY